MKLQKGFENKVCSYLNLKTRSNFKFMITIQFGPSITPIAVEIFQY